MSMPIQRDGFTVYPVKGQFVVADSGGWLPGAYASVNEAIAAAKCLNEGAKNERP